MNLFFLCQEFKSQHTAYNRSAHTKLGDRLNNELGKSQ